MSENSKHFFSDVPCKRCNSRIRYKSTRNCCDCLKASVAKRRANIAALVSTATPPADPLADLIGDINAPHR